MAIIISPGEAAWDITDFADFPHDPVCLAALREEAPLRLIVNESGDTRLLLTRIGAGFFIGKPMEGGICDVVECAAGMSGTLELRFLSLPSVDWLAPLAATYGLGFMPIERIARTLPPDAPLETPMLSGESDVRRLTAENAAAMSAVDSSFSWLWPDAARFEREGAGFGVFVGEALASVAWTSFRPISGLDISVATGSDWRGRRFCETAAIHLLRWAREQGLPMYWSTNRANTPSLHVADRLGFTNPVRHWWASYTPYNRRRRIMALPEQALQEYAGTYISASSEPWWRDRSLHFTVEEGELALRLDDLRRPAARLAPESRRRFFLLEADAQFTFLPGGGVIWRQSGSGVRFDKRR